MENEIIALTEKYVMNTYRRFPKAFVRGNGVYLWDCEGKQYIDLIAGIAVCSLGHCPPSVVRAIAQQSEKLLHVSNLFHIESQGKLAKILVENSFADKVFFCNSGAEAIEAAIKIVRKYSETKGGADRKNIIVMKSSFHGRTYGAISATGQDNLKKGFAPFLPGFTFVPYNDVQAVKNAITPQTCAILVEPIQGEAGVIIPDDGYLKGLRQICEAQDLLLVFDEVQVGLGRTGHLFAYEHEGVAPDVMVLAKALGSGLPIGAMLAAKKVAETFVPGDHASTFGGNPLVTTAAVAVMEELLADGFLQECAKLGKYFLDHLEGLKDKYDFFVDVRGRGLALALEIDEKMGNEIGEKIINGSLSSGLIINLAKGYILRFLPPLNITDSVIDEAMNILDEVCKEL